MIVDIEKYVPLLVQHKITPNQFLILYLTHFKAYDQIYRYVVEGKGWTVQELDDLENRGFMENFNKPGDSHPDQYVIGEEFVKSLFLEHESDTGNAFWDAFPPFLIINGARQVGRNYPKDAFLVAYYRKVGHNPKLHQRVMEALEYAKTNHLIGFCLKTWFETEQWTTIIEHIDAKPTNRVLPGERIY